MKNRVAVHIRVYRHAYTRVAIGLMYYAMTLPGREDDNAECLEARVSVGGLCASRRCSPPGGLHVLGTRLHRPPRSPPTGSFQVPDGTPSRPPGIAGIIILSRRPAHGRVARIFDMYPSIHHLPTMISSSLFPILLYP